MLKLKDMPKKIYLQIEDGVGEFTSLGECTWCTDNINSSDMEYRLVNSWKHSKQLLKDRENKP